MSEYQFYEFCAIDKPLTKQQMQNLRLLSSRASISSRRATFVYNYGDFRGDEKQLMTDYFDFMVYISSFGTKFLMIKIPSEFYDKEKFAPYFVSEEIDHWSVNSGKDVIIELRTNLEYPEWAEGEGWADELLPLREELMNGDPRPLFLAWINPATYLSDSKHPPSAPIPCGLNELTKAQTELLDLFDIDYAFIAAAAKYSNNINQSSYDLSKQIDKLSNLEKNNFLIDLSRDNMNLNKLSLRLKKKLTSLAKADSVEYSEYELKSISIEVLIKEADLWREMKKREDELEAQKAKANFLNDLDGRQLQVWKDVYEYIEMKKSRYYDEAIILIKQLFELAEFKNDWGTYNKNITNILKKYSNFRAFKSKLQNAELIVQK